MESNKIAEIHQSPSPPNNNGRAGKMRRIPGKFKVLKEGERNDARIAEKRRLESVMEEMTDSEEAAFGLESSTMALPSSTLTTSTAELEGYKGKPALDHHRRRYWDFDRDEREDYLGKAKEGLTYCLLALTILATVLLVIAVRYRAHVSANENLIYNKHFSFD